MIGEQSNQSPTVMVRVYHTHLMRQSYPGYDRALILIALFNYAKPLILLV